MPKQAQPPPPGDKPTPTAPPPPPTWRNLLGPVALAGAFVTLFVLPALHTAPRVNLTYTQFLTDVNAHKVKTVNIQSTGQTTGTLSDGHTFTTVIPVQLASSSLLNQLEANNVQIVASVPGPSFGAQVLSWALVLLPLLIFGWLGIRPSRAPPAHPHALMAAGR